ncbi:MAG: tetratricopeptide repeat protein [Bacteroidota bacterium]|nr:tetratricopeptide repeat protein [Bacteroidota bacterium]
MNIFKNNKIIYILLISIISLNNLKGFASETQQQLFEKANKEYSNTNYKEAINTYQQILLTGKASSEIYYNLGNAYFKTSNFPSALLFYEKARRLDPSNDDINFNIRLTNTKIVDKIEAIPEIFFIRWLKAIYGICSTDKWAKITIAFSFLIFFSLSIYLLAKNILFKRIAIWVAFSFLFLTVFGFIAANNQYNNAVKKKEAIMFSPSVTVKSSPDDNSTDLFQIHEGTKVSVIDMVDKWDEIKLANGNVGWVKSETLEII